MQRKLEEPDAAPGDRQAFEGQVLVLKELSQILGLFDRPQANREQDAENAKLLDGLMQLLMDLRNEARRPRISRRQTRFASA